MVNEITIQEFISLSDDLPIIDVRSPKEYEKGHIQNAINIPLFSNDERAHVGTVYKQKSKEKAIELGYTYVNPKLDFFISEGKRNAKNNRIAVHCWRGGMRSQSFAELLSDNGLKVFLITGGYKAFRNYALKTFDQPYILHVIGGYTGSGKTKILEHMEAEGNQVIDLEGLANHKGSAFGSIGLPKQPTTEMFENNLFYKLLDTDIKKIIWIEDESSNIGNVNIPDTFFLRLRQSKVFFIDIPKEKRAEFLVGDYANIDDVKLAESIHRISKRLGGLRAKESLDLLAKKDYYNVAIICLDYYDKYYINGLYKRDKEQIKIINSATIDIAENTSKIINEWKILN